MRHPVTTGRPALTAINLVADPVTLSALGNELGCEHVFVRQVAAQGRAGDALLGLSTSGNSANLLAAFAKRRRSAYRLLWRRWRADAERRDRGSLPGGADA